MTRLVLSNFFKLLFIVGILFSTQACSSMNVKETEVIEDLLANPRPVCVGRYMFDLPEQFYPAGSSMEINKEFIQAKPMPLPAFEQLIRLRQQELAATQTLNEINAPFLKAVHALPAGMQGVIFERNLTNQAPGYSRILEAHYYHEGVAFQTKLDTDNTDLEQDAELKEKRPTNTQARLAELYALLGRLHGVASGYPMPKGPAICYKYGYLVGDSDSVTGVAWDTWGQEKTSTVFKLKDYPRIKFVLKSNNYIQEDDSLLERSQQHGMLKLLGRFAGMFKSLHKGKRTIHGEDAEEWLIYNGTNSDSEQYHYMFYINEKRGSNTTPFLEVNMTYEPIGKGTEADELTETQLRAIWYRLTDSIRIRPGAL